MNNEIQITAEELVRETLKRYVTDHSSPERLLAETIRRLFPNSNGETVRAVALENSIAAGIRKMERQAAAAESEFEKYGQTTMWGYLIPEHCVPKQLLGKSTTEMRDWMENRARIEQENADEMQRAADAQQRKAKQFGIWSDATGKVYAAIVAMGLDPTEVSYAEALNKAETIQSGAEPVSCSSPKRPMR